MEIWNQIDNSPNYEISNLGKIRNIKGIILKTNIKNGYNRIALCNDGKRKEFRINQLVAKYFLNPLYDKYNIIHKNGNKLDDSVDNLEIKKLNTCIKVIINDNTKTIDEVINELNLDNSKIWKFVKDNTNFVISNDGIVFYIVSKQELKQYTNKKKYIYVVLNSIKHFVHILLAKTFLELDESKYYNVSHKDGNKNNNNENNLIIRYKQDDKIITLQDLTLGNEIWEPINGYDNFMVSNLGRIVNTDKMVVKSLKPHKTGYVRVNLCKSNVKKQYRVHCLVADVFIEKIEGKNIVNHKNGIKHDNRVENLEWTTTSGNIKHAIETGLLKINPIKTYADQNDIENEIWKDVTVINYSHYQVSNFGRIRNKNDNHILNPYKSKYCNVTLRNKGEEYSCHAHKLVALAFVPNPNKYKIINHINGIKTDNRVENLEWTTYKGNAIHAFETGLFKPFTRKVRQSGLDGKLIKEWSSIKEASIALKISDTSISQVCKRKRNYKTAAGFKWEYVS